GYAATTGRRVAERAGVTRGAQTHHFPHRLDLIVEAVERLGDRRAADLRHRARRLPTGDGRAAAVVDLVIEDFASDLF
ncbi:TetR family transcriptional regulator, partial [Leadbetterella sp. DM7]